MVDTWLGDLSTYGLAQCEQLAAACTGVPTEKLPQVQVARKRARFEERKQQKRSSEQAELPVAQPSKKAKAGPVEGLTKQQLVRTIAVGGFAPDQSDAVLAVASKAGKVRVCWPYEIDIL